MNHLLILFIFIGQKSSLFIFYLTVVIEISAIPWDTFTALWNFSKIPEIKEFKYLNHGWINQSYLRG